MKNKLSVISSAFKQLLIVQLLVCSQIISQNTNITKIIPEIENFSKDGNYSLYNSDNIFDPINGEADIYLEYGFNQMLVQKYICNESKNNINLEIFEMVDSDAVFGINSVYSGGKISIDDYTGEYSGSSDYLLLHKENYFIRITVFGSSNHKFQSDIQIIKDHLNKSLPMRPSVPALVIITSDLMENSDNTIYFRGSLGLSEMMFLDDSKFWEFEEGVFYKDKDRNTIIFNPGNKTEMETALNKTVNYFKEKGTSVDNDGNLKYQIIKKSNLVYKISQISNMVVVEKFN